MEKIVDKYYGLILGCVCAVVSVLSAYIYIIPIITVIPLCSFFESFAPSGSERLYSIIGLGALFFLSLSFVIYYGWKKGIEKSQMVPVFFFEWFVIHSLGFDILWWFTNRFRSDGQLIFLSISSFQVSSVVFILLGFLLMFLRRK